MLGQNIDFALEKGNTKLGKALCAAKSRAERLMLLKEIDRVLLGGKVNKAFRALSRPEAPERRIDVVPPKD